MIFLILAVVVFTMVYTDLFSYEFFNSFTSGGFGRDHYIILSVIVFMFVINVILDLQIRHINKSHFNRFFASEEEYHASVRKYYFYNSVNRFLLVFLLPIIFLFFYYLYSLINNFDNDFLRIALLIVNTFLMLYSFVAFYAVNILLPFNLLICADSGFGNYCDECRYGGFNTYTVSKKKAVDGYITYTCRSCGKEVKVESFRHLIFHILRNMHLIKHN